MRQSRVSESATDESTLSELCERDCWELLASHRYGRLAYHLAGEVNIVPINYAAECSSRRLLFRSDEGSKLLGVVMNADIAFEIDDVGEGSAYSVVAHGRATILDGSVARATENLPPTPWVGNDKRRVVSIDVAEVTGRRYVIDRGEAGSHPVR